MIYLGDFAAGDTVEFSFNTRTSTGAPVALAGGALAVYKDAGTSALTLSPGPVLDEAVGAVVGLHHVTLVLSDSDLVAGSDYSVVLSEGTVDDTDVAGTVLAQFSIANRKVPVDVGTIAAGAINAAAVADDAIDAGALATGAITADAIAAGVVSGSTLAGEIEDAVFEAAVSDHTAGTGTVGYALNAIWGHTDKLGAGLITVHSPITAQGDLTITQGDSYLDGDIVWTDSASTWPDLTPPVGTATLTITFHTTNLSKTLVPSPVGPAVQPTTLTMPALTPTDTAALDVGFQSYWIEAVWDDDPAALPAVDRRKTITRGVMYILAQRTA